ncbi:MULTISPECIES: sigma-70 family RNA polymerase sigma factor [Alteribacter]|uniref:Sigma-70 family RNA polymerase sigma factor n=1 Tax=Alteribacter keqinensis TaxID=2483800 RepID=A0A3M7TWU9_9BACI|nr:MULTISPECIES: sigma-70 family RNA polymerase sigma factor [Alteribacter]MBM7097677.1 sigma-70 family RNA polymerase sigma factor [Alteribacter salitolerans]RNA70110.1 sigma-70 family RNA polymerase sigma factor [Alteribacter keqinensis]
MYDADFEVVYEKYEPLIFSLLKKFRLHFDQEEYVQIARVALFHAWRRFDPDMGAFPAFAKRYIEGYLIRAIKKDRRLNDHCQLIEPVLLEDVAPHYKEESLQPVYEIMNEAGLSFRQKTWVEEAVIYECKPREIAARYKVSVDTVHTWRKGALKKLRSFFS